MQADRHLLTSSVLVRGVPIHTGVGVPSLVPPAFASNDARPENPTGRLREDDASQEVRKQKDEHGQRGFPVNTMSALTARSFARITFRTSRPNCVRHLLKMQNLRECTPMASMRACARPARHFMSSLCTHRPACCTSIGAAVWFCRIELSS